MLRPARTRPTNNRVITIRSMDKCLDNNNHVRDQRQFIFDVVKYSEDLPDVGQLKRRAVEVEFTNSIATIWCIVKLSEKVAVIGWLRFGFDLTRFEYLDEHHEHLVDIQATEVIELYHVELEALKKPVAREIGYDLVDHRVELFGRIINQI